MPEETSTSRYRITDPGQVLGTTGCGSRNQSGSEPGYYDLSILKPPVWKWEIEGYFFLGGISAGSFIVSSLARLLGNGRFRDLARDGAYVSFLAFIPCAPLLILDLGDPKRFHHMLRVFKPASPMNFGAWVLTAFSVPTALAALGEGVKEYRSSRSRSFWPVRFRRHEELLPPAAFLPLDLAGIPLALLLAGYTGILLSCTSNPVWCKSLWLGPLFSASSISTGANAALLALEARGSSECASKALLNNVATASHAVELVTLGGYVEERGPLAKPFTRGRYRKHMALAVGGIFVSEVLKRLPLTGKAKSLANVAGSLIGLAAGMALRSAIVYAGHDAANDPDLARRVTS